MFFCVSSTLISPSEYHCLSSKVVSSVTLVSSFYCHRTAKNKHVNSCIFCGFTTKVDLEGAGVCLGGRRRLEEWMEHLSGFLISSFWWVWICRLISFRCCCFSVVLWLFGLLWGFKLVLVLDYFWFFGILGCFRFLVPDLTSCLPLGLKWLFFGVPLILLIFEILYED